MTEYSGLVLQWKLFHPESIRERELVLATGTIDNIYNAVPIIARVGGGQVGYHRPVLLAFQVLRGQSGDLRTAVVTIKTRPQ